MRKSVLPWLIHQINPKEDAIDFNAQYLLYTLKSLSKLLMKDRKSFLFFILAS
jgi:hypothetical protein